MDNFGYNYDLSDHVSDIITIPSDTTWSQKRYIYNNIIIPNGVTLTVSNEIIFYEGATITLQGGTLNINGGVLYNADICYDGSIGADVVISNGGTVYKAPGKTFEIPASTTMEMYNGTIE